MNVAESPTPFSSIAGPSDAKLVIIGEAHGESEERLGGIPFAGAAGHELARMMVETGWDDTHSTLSRALASRDEHNWLSLREEWLHNSSIMITNVFAFRPINNNLGYLCAAKSELPSTYNIAQVRTENPRYVKPEHLVHLPRLYAELAFAERNLVLTLGSTATWAMTGAHTIGQLRGTIMHGSVAQFASDSDLANGISTTRGRTYKTLATYHPAAIFRAWQWRPIVLADLLKAFRERRDNVIRRPRRHVVINPTIDEIAKWVDEINDTSGELRVMLAPDIETMNGQIRCIGFARSRSSALVIPFIRDKSGASYWQNAEDEYQAWRYVQELLECPLPKVFQNGMFDMQYIIRAGLRIVNARHDTMLLHHSRYPEMQKGLGFLGSVYTDEPAWKLMRLHKGEEELKRDE